MKQRGHEESMGSSLRRPDGIQRVPEATVPLLLPPASVRPAQSSVEAALQEMYAALPTTNSSVVPDTLARSQPVAGLANRDRLTRQR